jgi:hypothetical protein
MSGRAARISAAERTGAGALSVAGAGVSETTGTVTSDLAAALRGALAGVGVAATGLSVAAGFLVVFLSAGIVFALTVDFEAGISNALYFV